MIPVEHDPFASESKPVDHDPFAKNTVPKKEKNKADYIVQEVTRAASRASDRGIADTLGAPIDVVNKGLSKIGLPTSSEPLGGSKSIRHGMRALGMVPTEEEPESAGGRALEGGLEGGTSALLSGGITGGLLKGAGKVAGSAVLEGAGEVAAAPVANLAVGTGAGAAGSATDNPILKPIAELVGGTATGMSAPGAAMREVRKLPDVLDSYERLKLAPSAAKSGLGGKSAAWVQSNLLPQTIGGSNVMENFKNRRLKELTDIHSDIAAAYGAPNTREGMGKALQGDVMDQWLEAKGRSGAVIEDIKNKYGADPIVPNNFIKAVENPKGGPTSEVVKERANDPLLVDAQNMIHANEGEWTVADLTALRTKYGAALEPGFQKNISDAQISDMYAGLRKDIEQHVKARSPQDHSELMAANEVYAKAQTDFKQSFKKLLGTKDVPVSSERAYDIIAGAGTETGRGDLREFRTVWDNLSKETKGNMAATILSKMGSNIPGEAVSPENFSLAKFIKGYGNLTPEAKDILFNSTGNGRQARALDDLAAVAKNIEEKINKLQSTSKSGTGMIQMGQMAAAASVPAAVGDPLHSVTALTAMLATIGGPYIASEMLTNPTAVKAMTGILNGVNLAIDTGARATILLQSLPKMPQKPKQAVAQ